MSLLPQRILPPTEPWGKADGEGNVIIDKNWWLFLYNIASKILGQQPTLQLFGQAGFTVNFDDGGSGVEGDYFPLPGPPGTAGAPGSAGTQGPPGTAILWPDDPPDDPIAIPGPPGLQGNPGSTGPAGSQGPTGTALLWPEDAPEEPMIVPGPIGPAGTAGNTGAQGPPGAAVFMEADAADEPMQIPGPPGQTGAVGFTGSQGPIGSAVYLEADPADEPMVIPGPPGIAGPTGTQGPQGVAVFMEADPAEEYQLFPGIPGTPGTQAPPLGFAGGLTGSTTINDNATPVTGGITLTSQTAAVGSVWRVRGHGQFVAATSVTARNVQIACFWGSTALPQISVPVLVSVGQTTNWECEFILTATSTTAIWGSGYLHNKIDYPAISAGVTAYETLTLATPASTTVSSGAQTLDLRFSMSVAVATDQWVVQNVTMERLK